MKLITETSNDFEVLEEEKSGQKNLFIEGIFLQSEIVNGNQRKYPKAIMAEAVKQYDEKYIKKNRAYGELGHPEGPTINPDRISHRITSLKEYKNNWIGKAQISSTPHGEIVKGLMKDGGTFAVSSRGLGSLKEVKGEDGKTVNEVQDDFFLSTAADIVIDPSAPDAFVEGIMEGREYIWDNGLLSEQDMEEYQKKIKATKQKDFEENFTNLFSDFMWKVTNA